jgi:hypothetical protein
VKRRRTRRSLRVKRAIERRERGYRAVLNWLWKKCYVKVVSDTLNRGWVVPKSVWS